MTMLPCVDDWNQLTTWNVNSSSWYCLATQIFRLLMVSEGSYTAFTRGYHGVLSQAVFSPHPATVLLLHSGIILPSVSGCFEWFCPSVFPTEMFAFLCVLRAKSPAHFLLCCLFHPNNVLWKGQRSRVTRALCCMCVVCVCVCVSVSDRSRFQFLYHLTDVHVILCRNYATGGRSHPKFPTPSSDNMADTWTCEVGGMIVPLV